MFFAPFHLIVPGVMWKEVWLYAFRTQRQPPRAEPSPSLARQAHARPPSSVRRHEMPHQGVNIAQLHAGILAPKDDVFLRHVVSERLVMSGVFRFEKGHMTLEE